MRAIPVASLAAAVLLSTAASFAQTEFGAIVGTVTDPSSAAIPRAPVSIRETQTGSQVELSTDESGSYTSPPLRPGNYEITVEVAGFRKVTKTISLDVNQRARVNFSMEVGQVSDSVTVAAESPLLETQSAALGNVRTTKAVRHPPRSGWLDELGRLKDGRSLGLGVARCAPYWVVQNCPAAPSAVSCSRMYVRTCSSSNPTVDTA